MYRQYLIAIVIAAVAAMLAMGAVEHWKRLETGGGVPRPSSPGLAQPNVVLIVVDALRADRVDAVRNGEPVMPKLARYGRENVRFTNVATACTWTRPSMASMLTSLYVDTHQVYFGPDARHPENGGPNDRLPAACETLATYLKKAGYATSAVQTNVNCAASLGFAEGFDRYEELGPVPANTVTDHALRQVGESNAPFFLYVHYLDPHIPYEPPEAYRKIFGFPPPLPAEELKTVTDFMDYFWDHIDHLIGNTDRRAFTELSDAAKDAVRTLYDGESRFLDDELARLLEGIRARQPNTVIVITSDHGEHFWEHGRLGHGLTEYREELDVPLILSGPGQIPKTIDILAETVDIAPTIAALLHLKPNPRWQGVNVFSRPEDRPAFSLTNGCWPAAKTELAAVMLGSLKLIADRRTGLVELYDIAEDPRETRNIASDRPEDAEKLKDLLAKHRNAAMQARVAGPSAPPAAAPLDPAIAEQLKALGYVR
ncbi:MAG TPA: sulfatase [Candidatus Hydrogenedentes bacterium]|nr:sulfatase [Candidatus Hydrogenedentota bacterium]HPC15947.1 sulfatase [Candidatus Hydrogenedentota bacterium]HRT19901.1 sulfatase [Candidatus Hydrogenedentota bacterium]HRT66330.1 sulfatase [Candidatus Hydrogenedentota bacterium]